MRLIIKICSLLFFIQAFSQTQTITNQDKIKNYLDAYFQYDRENIHVQFNKNIYVNSEDIVYKGYVWSKNNNLPNANTTNMQLIVYNEQQEIVLKQLLFTDKGAFSGGIHLTDKFKSGKYTFHFFTNWMNNFKEDDSFTQVIEIINHSDSYAFNTNEPNWKSATVTLFPEGGNIINEANNMIGVNIKDCHKKGIETQEGVILDSQSNEVSHFHTNKMGNGAFYLIPKMNETYTLKINSDKLTISQPLPKVQETGIIITYNNNLPNNKLIVDIKTNTKGLELYQNKKFTLLIQQDGKLAQKEITFGTEIHQSLLFDKQKLSTGVNSIRLIDENLNEITERLVYIYPVTTPTTTLEARAMANDSIVLSGKTAVNQANLSINVLPENNACMSQKRSIIGTFYLNAYLENPEIDNYAYYDIENKSRKQDMDLLMLNQKNSKFLWENIKLSPPKITHQFDKGVTISGKVDKKMTATSKNKISLVALKENVIDEAPIDKNSNFKFENFFVKDSTVFVLEMVNEKNMAIATKIDARVVPNQTMFPLPITFDTTVCPIEKKSDTNFTFSKQMFESGTDLKEVVIKGHSTALKHTTEAAMSAVAESYKINEKDFGSVLSFINRKGFNAGVDPESNDVFIKNKQSSYSQNNGPSPSVYLDNLLLSDFNILFSIYLNDVDEIYIDPTGNSDVTTQGIGTIKIFLREKKKYFNAKYSTLIATKGFTQDIKYTPSFFETQKEFYIFGTLNWSPNIIVNNGSYYEIKFPKGNQQIYQVLLEGFSDDGQLVSEIKKVPISN